MRKTIRKVLVLLVSMILIMASNGAGYACSPSGVSENKTQGGYYMYQSAPNEYGIAQMLLKNGTIPANATSEQMESAVQAYVQKKLTKQPLTSQQGKRTSWLKWALPPKS